MSPWLSALRGYIALHIMLHVGNDTLKNKDLMSSSDSDFMDSAVYCVIATLFLLCNSDTYIYALKYIRDDIL